MNKDDLITLLKNGAIVVFRYNSKIRLKVDKENNLFAQTKSKNINIFKSLTFIPHDWRLLR